MATSLKSPLDIDLILSFKKIVGDDYVLIDVETLLHYSHDETEDLHFPPDLVIKPRTTEEISAIMKECNAKKIPVTPRGAGTGLSGGHYLISGVCYYQQKE